MDVVSIVFLTIAALFTSALTAVVGAGGGTALLALMLQVLPPGAAIPIHGAVLLSSNAWRVWIFRDKMAWPLIWRFGVLLPPGTAIGLWLFQGLPTETIQILIGCFVLLSLFTRQIKALRDKELPLWAFFPLGFITGTLNVIVGVIAPVLGALIIRKELDRKHIVGTLGFFGLIGNLFKVVGFTLIGFSFAEYGLAILSMIPAALIGTSLGKHLLGRINERLFLLAFKVMLAALAFKLIAIDGLGLFRHF